MEKLILFQRGVALPSHSLLSSPVQEHSKRSIIILEENMGLNLYDFGLSSGFLDSDTRSPSCKRRDKLNFTKINNFRTTHRAEESICKSYI